MEEETKWYLPAGFKPEHQDKSQRYIISELQMRKLFTTFFTVPLLDFNRDFVKEFIKKEKLIKTKQIKKDGILQKG